LTTKGIRSSLFFRAFLVALLPALAACVERRLFVRTDPPGGEIKINGEVIGRAPTVWRFDHYGTVLVEAELAGHEPVQQAVKLSSPWYQKPVLDFFADVVVPARIHDDHEVELRLEPFRRLSPREVEREVAEVTRAADKLKKEAEAER